jgi:hypothetical protein
MSEHVPIGFDLVTIKKKESLDRFLEHVII